MDSLQPSGRSQSMPKPWKPTASQAPNLQSHSTSGGGGSWRERETQMSVDLQLRQTLDDKPGKAVTVEHKLISPGVYSTWVRVLSADIGSTQLSAVLNRCEESNSTGSIHVYLREKYINRAVVQQLRSQGYKFHHYVEDTQTFVYGKRPQDADDGRELMNATARELVGALVLSPDEKQVLLAWEGGKWMFLSGYTITRENIHDSLRREVRTQVGLELDRSFVPKMVGGWDRAAEKGDCINDIFLCFVVKSANLPSQALGDEVRWFAVADLIRLVDMVDAQTGDQPLDQKLNCAVEHPPGNVFSHLTLRWIKAFATNRSLESASVAGRQVFVCM